MSEAMQRIIDMNADVLTPDQAAPVLRCSAQWLRLMGRKHPDQLPFPVLVVGNRVKIPRRPFLAFLGITTDEMKVPSDPHYATQNGGCTG